MKPIGLVIPTRWEAAEIRRQFEFHNEGGGLCHGKIGEREVLLRIPGVGAEKARDAAYRLCAAGAGELVSAGFCGALIPGLAIGTLVQHRLTSSPVPVKTMEERRALAQKASAIAVDMETQAIVEAGTRRGVPVRMLRVVSDRFEDDLTPLFGKNGKFSAVGIAFRLLNPTVWPLAVQLRAQSRVAAARLADALQNYVRVAG